MSERPVHGYLGSATWPLPSKILHCDQEARPGYATVKAHEYNEEDSVLSAKVKLLTQMIRDCSNFITYTGAGISTGAGIGDYASRSAGKASAAATIKTLVNSYSAQPTLAHYCLVDLYFAGYLKWWCQQNHDGLPQKAGMPQCGMNEIHGAWWDPSNPVVKMDGNLREDLFHDLLEWEKKADLCLAVGTSLSGMNADRVVETPALAAIKRRKTETDYMGGAVIVGIQCTRLDDIAALRIYANIDKVMSLLVEELQLSPALRIENGIKTQVMLTDAQVATRTGDIFYIIGYDGTTGRRIKERACKSSSSSCSNKDSQHMILNLSEDARVRIVHGPYAGAVGVVQGKTKGGDYDVLFQVPSRLTVRKADAAIGGSSVGQLLTMPWRTRIGLWMIADALLGSCERLPIVNES